jgi:hypothetical protein
MGGLGDGGAVGVAGKLDCAAFLRLTAAQRHAMLVGAAAFRIDAAFDNLGGRQRRVSAFYFCAFRGTGRLSLQPHAR